MQLPIEYRWLKAHKFIGLMPWWFMDVPGHEGLILEYKKETGDDFYPFAMRQDCDDVAGFKVVNGNIQSEVISVHLTWSGKKEVAGFPSRAEYKNIFSWLQEEVLVETEYWISEEDIDDLSQKNA